MFKRLVQNGLEKVSCMRVVTRDASYRASLNSIKRPVYARMYPVTLVKPDGSSITIKYHEPIAIIKLPFDINQLNETEKKRRMLKRQMSSKGDRKSSDSVNQIMDKTVKFDPKKYLNLTKKK
ncbi:39S ribosomal mitochondrial [Brachionus plicatilis]|uniref:39S ribosomal mitochondrial n=1 Tax=Brachionus plicatilis TaxID=10195 RepID=A0A3M7T0F8_BRAPC|nr:39S ribosomal mitochondrial [Brachionus plicatilis]